MTSCSIIIVNYNTGELLKRVVDAALKDSLSSEIIVVDNCSHDGSMDLLQDSEKLKKYYRKENHGFAPSCNYGADIAKGEVLLFLNPDCIVEENTISELFNNLNKDSGGGIMGCRINNPDGSEQRACRRRLPTFWRAIKTFTKIEKLAKYCHCFAGVNLSHQKMPTSIQRVEAISGAFMMIKAKVFEKVKGFDEKYPMHFEDLDLFKRTLDAKYTILFNPNISVIHYQGTSSQTNPKVAELKKIGRQRYFKKHLTYLSYLLVRFLK